MDTMMKFKTMGTFFDKLTSLKVGEEFNFLGRLVIYGLRYDGHSTMPLDITFGGLEGSAISLTADNSCPGAGKAFQRYFLKSHDSTLYLPIIKDDWTLVAADPGLMHVCGPHVTARIWGLESRVYLIPNLSR